jgi:hypothetical protein
MSSPGKYDGVQSGNLLTILSIASFNVALLGVN